MTEPCIALIDMSKKKNEKRSEKRKARRKKKKKKKRKEQKGIAATLSFVSRKSDGMSE